jgi:hypothetical protein
MILSLVISNNPKKVHKVNLSIKLIKYESIVGVLGNNFGSHKYKTKLLNIVIITDIPHVIALK